MSERIKSAVSIDWSQQQKSLSNQSVSYLEKGLKGFAGGIKKWCTMYLPHKNLNHSASKQQKSEKGFPL